MGLISGAMMAGFAQGAGKGLTDFLESEEKQRLEEARLRAQEAMEIRAENRQIAREDRAIARQKAQAGEISARATAMAGDRMGGLISTDADREALKDGGLTDYEIEQRMNPKASYRDRIAASAELGYDPIKGDVEMERIDSRDKQVAREERKLDQADRSAALAEKKQAANEIYQRLQIELGEKRLEAMMARIAKGNSGGSGDGDPAEVKTIKHITETLNAERKAEGKPPVTFAEVMESWKGKITVTDSVDAYGNPVRESKQEYRGGNKPAAPAPAKAGGKPWERKW